MNDNFGSLTPQAFEKRVIAELLVVSPDITFRQLQIHRDQEIIEGFKANAKKLGLLPHNYEPIETTRQLHEVMMAIRCTISAAARSIAFWIILTKRLLRSARRCQRFIRVALARSRAKKANLLHRWKTAELAARQAIRSELDKRSKKIVTISGTQLLEEIWDMYLYCWVSKEDKEATIEHLWRTRKLAYLEEFRKFVRSVRGAATVKLPSTSTSRRTITHRRAIADPMLAFPPMSFAPSSVSMAEMAYHWSLVHAHRIERAAALRRRSFVGMQKPRSAAPVVAQKALVSPVSLYHALLMFKPTQFNLVLFLKRLQEGEPFRLPPAAVPSVRQQAEQAVAVFHRWKTAATGAALREQQFQDSTESNPNAFREGGQPLPRYLGGGSLSIQLQHSTRHMLPSPPQVAIKPQRHAKAESSVPAVLSVYKKTANVHHAPATEPRPAIGGAEDGGGGEHRDQSTEFAAAISSERVIHEAWAHICEKTLSRIECTKMKVPHISSLRPASAPRRHKAVHPAPRSPPPVVARPPLKARRPLSARAPLARLVPCPAAEHNAPAELVQTRRLLNFNGDVSYATAIPSLSSSPPAPNFDSSMTSRYI